MPLVDTGPPRGSRRGPSSCRPRMTTRRWRLGGESAASTSAARSASCWNRTHGW